MKRFAVVAALAATIVTAAPAHAQSAARVTMPPLTGPYPVGAAELHLVDATRADPWKPDRRRELMVSVSYPAAHGGQRAPWMSPGIAAAVDTIGVDLLGVPPGSVDWKATRRHAREADRGPGRWPVVLFSHGLGSLREMHAGLADDLASRGYVVVSMSHTFEAAAVEFPGRVEYSVMDQGDPAARKTAIDARVADTSFVLTELGKRGFDLSRVGMAGHSYGGYTAGESMVHDRRIDAGVNLDGTMGHGPGLPGEVVGGLDRPFMLVGAGEHSQLTDPTWAEFRANQRGWERELYFDGGSHYSFTDLQFAVPQLGGLISPERRAALVGTIDPAESLAAQHEYLAGYFDLHLKGRDRRMFEGNSPCFPQVRFVE
ncbi:alpha/beta hydrolase family protein [Actinokineospora sp. HUAS TT18]|uniref:alpha/beta hydrolase family protein n=1 Tax=Actinokineospora sp. HUAS TT18 TaxID=3447451 RepID=UPI003F52430C